MLLLPKLAGQFPFRLGATSYILPADVTTNVRALAGCLDDIEIVFFESDNRCPLPNTEEIRLLSKIASKNNLSYTIHLPLNLNLGQADRPARLGAAETCKRIISHARMLDPFAYVLHLERPEQLIPSSDDLRRWRDRAADAVETLLPKGILPSMICIENLDYPFDWVRPIVDHFGFSICVDVGHLVTGGFSIWNHLNTTLHLARVIHLHGVQANRDHLAITHLSTDILNRLYTLLATDTSIERVVTLEVFEARDLEDSIRIMKGLLR